MYFKYLSYLLVIFETSNDFVDKEGKLRIFINIIVDYNGHVRSSVNHANVILDIDRNLRSSVHVILNNDGHMRIFLM